MEPELVEHDPLEVRANAKAVVETGALDAAFAADLAVGYWDGLDDLR